VLGAWVFGTGMLIALLPRSPRRLAVVAKQSDSRRGLAGLGFDTPIWLAVVVVVLVAAVSPVAAIAVATAVPVAVVLRRRRRLLRVTERRAAVVSEVADLIGVVVGSGGTVLEAIRIVAARGPEPVRDSWQRCAEYHRAGAPLGLALASAADDLGEAYRPVCGALAAADRDGSPLSALLARLGDEGRLARRQQLERRSKQLPVRLLFPLVLCALPAVIIGAVVPLVVVSIGRL
jgi:tight adherence protein C